MKTCADAILMIMYEVEKKEMGDLVDDTPYIKISNIGPFHFCPQLINITMSVAPFGVCPIDVMLIRNPPPYPHIIC